MKNKAFLSILSLLLLTGFGSALAEITPRQNVDNKPPIEVYFFRGEGCPHCAQAEAFFGNLTKQYPQLDVKSFEVFYNNTNRQIYFSFAQAYNISSSQLVVPVIFVGNQSWVGFDDSIASQITSAVQNCSINTCPSPQSFALAHAQQQQNQKFNQQALIGWVIILVILGLIIFAAIKLFKRKK